MFCRILCCFVTKSWFTQFCRDICFVSFAWRKIQPRIAPAEKKWLISGMGLVWRGTKRHSTKRKWFLTTLETHPPLKDILEQESHGYINWEWDGITYIIKVKAEMKSESEGNNDNDWLWTNLNQLISFFNVNDVMTNCKGKKEKKSESKKTENSVKLKIKRKVKVKK